MVDIVDAETRSRMMRGIRGKDTKPERDLRAALEELGLMLETHNRELPGQPDIVLNHEKLAILVHGCFWHRHPQCRLTTTPASRPEFWHAKFDANVARDARNLSALHQLGWRTAIVWECSVKRSGAAQVVAWRVRRWLAETAEQHLEIGDSHPVS